MVINSNFKFMVLVTFSLLSANYSKSGHCHTQLITNLDMAWPRKPLQ